ncbi:hypothetical protein GJAV_G00006520 [Gymnothorax javanicus]|nr:hypothetical protein GJAV_G00006520 [Gymnothorax javanicus]
MEMKLLCLEIVMLMAGANSALPTEAVKRYHIDETGRECRLCPPGQYQADCSKCSDCPQESFTSHWNTEESCLPCHRDCRKEFNLQEVQKCSPVSDVLCKCIDGFICKDFDRVMGHCKYCEVDTISTFPPALPKKQKKGSSEIICAPGTFLSLSSNCDPQTSRESPTDIPTHMPDTGNRELWLWVGLILFLVISVITLAIIFTWRRTEGACLKQLFKLCSNESLKGGKDATAEPSHIATGQFVPKEAHRNGNSLHNNTGESLSNQPTGIDQDPKASGNLGPFHIYSAGTVFVSLLNHFANPARETEGEKRVQSTETPPPPSPPIHLSEEERESLKGRINLHVSHIYGRYYFQSYLWRD